MYFDQLKKYTFLSTLFKNEYTQPVEEYDSALGGVWLCP